MRPQESRCGTGKERSSIRGCGVGQVVVTRFKMGSGKGILTSVTTCERGPLSRILSLNPKWLPNGPVTPIHPDKLLTSV